jgi:putative transposase
VAQRFQRCDKVAMRETALAEVLMSAPPRGNTGYSVYFITASTAQRAPLFRKEPMAKLLVEVLFHYRDHKNYLLHEFVLMPDHFHLLISPTLSLERSLQLIKGGFSYRAKKELGFAGEIWEKSFYDRRVRGAEDYLQLQTIHPAESSQAGAGGCDH